MFMSMEDKCIRFPESDCLGLHKAGELRRQNSNSHERFFDRLNALESQEGIQQEQYKHIMEKLTQLTTDVAEIRARPARRWEGIVEQVIGIVVAAVVGFMLAKFGM